MFVKNKEGLRSSEIFLKFFDGYVAMNDFFVSLQRKDRWTGSPGTGDP